MLLLESTSRKVSLGFDRVSSYDLFPERIVNVASRGSSACRIAFVRIRQKIPLPHHDQRIDFSLGLPSLKINVDPNCQPYDAPNAASASSPMRYMIYPRFANAIVIFDGAHDFYDRVSASSSSVPSAARGAACEIL